MSTCLLVIDDGRGHLDGCLESIAWAMPEVNAFVLVDDSAHKLGFAGAIQAGWDAALEAGCDYVFHLESDFRFPTVVPLVGMRQLLDVWGPQLAQVSLKRQPCNDLERAAGGVVEQAPQDFERGTEGLFAWLRHRRYFTTNPSLYRTDLCERGWPQIRHSEGDFTRQLLEDGHDFALFGDLYEPPRCWHVGEERTGHGY